MAEHHNQPTGRPMACAKWARDRILVQGMPLLVAQAHKLSRSACIVPCFKEKGAALRSPWGKGGGNVGVQEFRVHTARQPPSQMPVTLVSQLSANRGPSAW